MPFYDLQINGQAYTVDAEAHMPLLWVLRDLLGLTGTKFSCGAGLCGSCTVLIDGEPTRSCITLVESTVGKTITTIEETFTGWFASTAKSLDRRAVNPVRLLPAGSDF